MDKIKLAGVVLFCGALALGGLASLLLPPREYSVRENRVLTVRPDLDWEDVLDGSYQEDYERYLSDQMPGRERWVKLAVGLERLTGHREINGVYLGKEGYLLEEYHPSEFDKAQIEENIDLLAAFLDDMRERYGENRVSCLLLPEKAAAIPNRLPEGVESGKEEEEQVMAGLRKRLKHTDSLLEAAAELQKYQGEYLYYRTDHHWTTLGAYYGYRFWAEQTGHKAGRLKDYERETVFEDFFGTTYNKAPIQVSGDRVELFHSPQEEGITIYSEEWEKPADSCYFPETAREGFNRYQVFFSGNAARIKITTKAETKRRLLVIKDSFANCFVPFLLGDYKEIWMIDFRYEKENLYDILEEYEGVTDILVLYNMKNFMQEQNLHKLNQQAGTMEKFDADSFFDEEEEEDDWEEDDDSEITLDITLYAYFFYRYLLSCYNHV
ncbi:MAG: DHHW family protein [Lachnospiraceae bacterium]|nr:DHHW family protein [Lachnospiraceae bacterium]